MTASKLYFSHKLKIVFVNWGFFISLIAITTALCIGQFVSPNWIIKQTELIVTKDHDGNHYYYNGRRYELKKTVAYHNVDLSPEKIYASKTSHEVVVTEKLVDGQKVYVYFLVTATRHWQLWSLLPAILAVVLCWVTKNPVFSLGSGIVCGALLMGDLNPWHYIVLPNVGGENPALMLILYLWFLGGLLGIWTRTGASVAFAEYITQKFVRGPRSAKLVAWFLGMVFFQGGSISSVIVGTTVKPIADREKVSHEELALVVDSTSSPVAALIAFNALPAYVQTLIYISGITWLATEKDRIAFFFSSIPYSFYAIFAVTSTFLISIEKFPFLGKKLRTAITRARETGQLDASDAMPLSSKQLGEIKVPSGYSPHIIDFIAPLLVLLIFAIGSFLYYGVPEILGAFGMALVCALILALIRGMSLSQSLQGMFIGWRGIIFGCMILLLAISMGNISKLTGGAVYLVDLLGDKIPYYLLPTLLLGICITISFSTGTSLGTLAVVLPLAMPLSHNVALYNQIVDIKFYMMICFATVLNGSIFGDQCSPISDTTILSSMCTGCDLMDHVKTQMPIAIMSALLATLCWTICVIF